MTVNLTNALLSQQIHDCHNKCGEVITNVKSTVCAKNWSFLQTL